MPSPLRHHLLAALLLAGLVLAGCDHSEPPQPEPDPEPPRPELRPPHHLSLTVHGSEVTLTWEDRSVRESGYRVYRSAGDGPFVEAAVLRGDSVMTYAEGAEGRLVASYRVQAFSEQGQTVEEGPASLASYDLAPTDVVVVVTREAGDLWRVEADLEISWTDNSTFEEGFVVERRHDFGPYEEVARTGPDVVTTAERVSQSGRYAYRVRAVTGEGPSGTAEGAGFSPGWTRTADGPSHRGFNDAVVLEDGTVFLADMGNGGHTLFDPSTHTWAPAVWSNQQGTGGWLVRLPSGSVFSFTDASYAALYDPRTRQAREFGCPTMLPSDQECPPGPGLAAGHRAALLPDGSVLIAGADNETRRQPVSKRYTPSTDAFDVAPGMGAARQHHTMTGLPDGSVLATGGSIDPRHATHNWNSSAELYDPRTGTWKPLPPMAAARVYHEAVLLDDGRVLVCGGEPSPPRLPALERPTCDLFHPSTGAWTTTAPLHAPEFLTMAKLPDGRVLAITGRSYRTPESTEMYDPETKEWLVVGRLPEGLGFSYRPGGVKDYTLTRLRDGRLLLTAAAPSHYGYVPAFVWRR